jgi:hypothetical protein
VDTENATMEEDILLESVTEPLEQLKNIVKRPEITNEDDLIAEVVFETGADHKKVRQWIDRVISPEELNRWFADIREGMADEERLPHKTKLLIIQGHQVYVLKNIKLTTFDLNNIRPALDNFFRVFQVNKSIRRILPGVYNIRLDRIKSRLFVREFDNKVVIVNYGLTSDFKKSERSAASGMSLEIEEYFERYSAKRLPNFEDFQSEFNVQPIEVDSAMSIMTGLHKNAINKNLGGIDFNTNIMNLQLQNGGQRIKFHLDPVQLAQLQNAPGFTPVIINIQPMKNLRAFLGIA